MEHTEMCVYCLKRKAKHWSGHVTLVNENKTPVLAGYCDTCWKKDIKTDFLRGWSGHYLPAMGILEQKRKARTP